MSERPKPIVVCAAIRSKAGKIIAGARHYDEVMRQNFIVNGERPKEWWGCEQGFIDQFCNFLTREEAWKIAEENGQIRNRCGGDNGVLYSENLY